MSRDPGDNLRFLEGAGNFTMSSDDYQTISSAGSPPRQKGSMVLRRCGLVGLVGLLATTSMLFGGVAWAHVTVDPPSAPQGGTVKLSFLAPNEEAPARVTRVQIFFPVPPATPIPTVTVEPKPGWTFKLTMLHLAKPLVTDDGSIADIVSEIDWTADNAASQIGPSEFGEFTIDADGLPDHGTQVVFKALQTYSNGQVVRWIEPVPATGDAPEHPTPILQLTSANGTPAAAPASTATAAKASTKDTSARTIGIIALAVGILALVAAAGALMSKRRTA